LAVCSAAAAAVKLPRSTTAAKASIPAKLSMRAIVRQGERSVQNGRLLDCVVGRYWSGLATRGC
jgi:hypothetical protein